MTRSPYISKEEIVTAADCAEGMRPAESKGRTGRPSKYEPTFSKQAEKLCALGATDEDLAEFFDVSIRTIANWKSRYQDFLQALKGGKDSSDDRVERSLYQRAVGYTFDSEKVFNNRGEIVRAKTREHCPPDVTAQIFWLKNRRPEEWRDKSHHELTGKDGGPIEHVATLDLEQLTDEEIRAYHTLAAAARRDRAGD